MGRNGSVGRIKLLNFNLKRLRKHGKWSPATVTSAMNAAATQDVRAIVMVPLLAQAAARLDATVAAGRGRCSTCFSSGARMAATGST